LTVSNVAPPELTEDATRDVTGNSAAPAPQKPTAIPVFHARGLSKIYHMGEVDVHALRDVDLDIFEREFVVLLGPSGSGKSTLPGPDIKRTIAPKSLERFKRRIREITRRAKGVSIKTTMEELAPYMRGWCGYFGFCETPEVLIALTRWVRLRLRAALWRQWKTPRRRRAALIAL
jgi:hypothetical protein